MAELEAYVSIFLTAEGRSIQFWFPQSGVPKSLILAVVMNSTFFIHSVYAVSEAVCPEKKASFTVIPEQHRATDIRKRHRSCPASGAGCINYVEKFYER